MGKNNKTSITSSSSTGKKRQLPSKPTHFIPRTKKIAHFDSPLSDLSTTQRCELIAEISEAVLEDPQAAFTKSKGNHNEYGDDGDGDDETNK